jgi:hypothetical protein
MKSVAKAYNEGSSMAQVARDHKLTRQRVLQILRHQCPRYSIGVISNEEWMELQHRRWFKKG